ncbi:high mobility group box domain-containing protein [Umbelopsis sp. AD052]|nr:high mobility group box domain-containing protein [Umbelopsis sp. AD052]
MTSKPSDSLKQELTVALEAAAQSLLATAELIKKVGSLEVTAASELEDGKKKRKTKDPNAPKRPPGSYFLFANDRRSKLASEKPNLNNTEIMSLLADEWSKLGEKQKKAWTQKAATAMESYKKEHEAYKAKQADASDDTPAVVEEKKEVPATKGKKRAKAEPKKEEEVEEKTEEEPKKKRGRQSAAAKESKPAAKESKPAAASTKKASKAKKSS